MRVLWISDSPETPSGFGNVTRFVCRGLARRGHDVHIIGWQTKDTHEWELCTVHPSVGRLGSNNIFPFLVRNRPDVVIALADVWWLSYFCAPHVRRQMELTGAPWALYFPIDGDIDGEHLPPSWLELLRSVDIPIAMSRYGQRLVSQQGIASHYIPHGVDLEIFCPPADREEAKARIEAEGRFVVLSDSRNQPRKMLPRLLDIFAKFVRVRPDAVLHLHTDPNDEFTQSGIYSYDVRADVRRQRLESNVRFSAGMAMTSGGGLPLDRLAGLYQAADVHLLASSGEGFGLPTLQAAAAGAVPMAGAYTASLELVEGHGRPIAIADWTVNEFGIRRGLIDIDDAVAQLTELAGDRHLLGDCSVRSREFALAYGWDAVVDQWDSLLGSIARSPNRLVRRSPERDEPVVRFAPALAPRVSGAAVSIKVVERRLGWAEASIQADARRLSDVRMPALLDACELQDVRVPRTIGYIGMGAGDVPLFEELKRIFPILSGWVAASYRVEPDRKRPEFDALDVRPFATAAHARFDVAQSILMLNTTDELPEQVLIDGGLYGVPCVGSASVAAQRDLWPEIACDDFEGGFEMARALLTNAALMRRVSVAARERCRRVYAPDEEDSVRWLRQLHAQQHAAAAVAASPR
jgi:glycosyltransferase involved in cell wall biosynthesis